MTWTRLGDNFNTRADFLEVPRSARLLHVEALVYCNQELRNGNLPRGALRRITDSEDPDLDAKHLVDAGVWQEVSTGWLIDWSDQEDSEVIRERKTYRAETQKRYRERKEKHGRGDHSMCDIRFCKNAPVTDNATSNTNGHETPSLPVPSRPKGRGQGQGWHGAGAPANLPEENRRWRESEFTPDAHQFIPPIDGGPHCSFTWDNGPSTTPMECGSSAASWQHGHKFVGVVDDDTCAKCGQLETHAVHGRPV